MVETMDQKELEKARSDVRLTQLEIDTQLISKDVKQIRDNHLHHMAQDIDRVENKIDKMDQRLWAIMFMIVALAASNVLLGFLK
jgi:uncharacterized protein Yka (UPF0111/DUF47 family)